MRTETTHTPTPWKVLGKKGQFYITTDRNKIDGDFQELLISHISSSTWETDADSPGERSKANAAFIVRAVNAHEGLLSLLKEARNRMIGSSPAIVDLAKRTDAAIAKAEGK